MPHDPTAKAAERNVEGAKRAAYIAFRNEDGQPERVWFDPDTLKLLIQMGGAFRDETGERHFRFKKEVAALGTNITWAIDGPLNENAPK